MPAFDIVQLICDLEEIQMLLAPGRKITPEDREIAKLRFNDMRRFFGMCIMRKEQVEKALDWANKVE